MTREDHVQRQALKYFFSSVSICPTAEQRRASLPTGVITTNVEESRVCVLLDFFMLNCLTVINIL